MRQSILIDITNGLYSSNLDNYNDAIIVTIESLCTEPIPKEKSHLYRLLNLITLKQQCNKVIPKLSLQAILQMKFCVEPKLSSNNHKRIKKQMFQCLSSYSPLQKN